VPVSVVNTPVVSVNNFPSQEAVTVANFPTTQPVSGTVAVSNFPASVAVTQPVPGNLKSAIYFGDSPALDALGRLRTSCSTNLLQGELQYGLEPVVFEAGNTSDGVAPAFVSATRMATLQVNAGATGGSSFMQSFLYVPSWTGKSQQIIIGGLVGTATAGAVKRFGYGDAANGVFFEQNSSGGLQMNRRSSCTGSVVDNAVLQTSWNLDPLNGTGPSGLTFDVTKVFCLYIDIHFATGRVRVGFDIGGTVYYVHQFLSSNTLTVPLMQTVTLPVLAEIQAAAGLASAATSYFKCGAVNAEDGADTASVRSFGASVTGVTATTSRTHAMSLRPVLTFGGFTNRVTFYIADVEVLAGSNAVLWELLIGATFSVVPTWADVNTGSSAFQIGTGGTYSGLVSGGRVISAGFVGTVSGQARVAIPQSICFEYPISLDRSGAVRALGTVTLVLTSLASTSVCATAIDWNELR
jgi:hypothetical protein